MAHQLTENDLDGTDWGYGSRMGEEKQGGSRMADGGRKEERKKETEKRGWGKKAIGEGTLGREETLGSAGWERNPRQRRNPRQCRLGKKPPTEKKPPAVPGANI